jgi:ADP-ribose pyrophosphatase YjhB (NUDIX family)
VIRFDEGRRRFNYRVVGVAIHRGMVLVHRADGEPFWTLPGGRAEMGEVAEHTIRREIREELSTEVEVGRLLWFVENFFDYDGLSYHELALYFLIRFPPGSRPLALSAFEATDGDARLQFRWFPRREETLANLPLLPSFVASGLTKLPASVTHIVHRDAVSPIAPV